MTSERAREVLARLGGGLDHPDAEDLRALVEYVVGLGAGVDEIIASAALESLGPLALDFSVCPRGRAVPLDEFAMASRLDPALAHRLWRALGLPESPPMPFPSSEVVIHR